jgi:hypothetical protein
MIKELNSPGQKKPPLSEKKGKGLKGKFFKHRSLIQPEF